MGYGEEKLSFCCGAGCSVRAFVELLTRRCHLLFLLHPLFRSFNSKALFLLALASAVEGAAAASRAAGCALLP